jgi:hypothetical protein
MASQFTTLCVALTIYGVLLVMVAQRINRMLIVCVLTGSPRQTPPLTWIADGQVHVLGQIVPLIAVIGASAIPPLWWWAARVYDQRLRRDRARLGGCLECGQPLAGQRGRCPECGERFERSGVRERIVLVAPRKTLAHR